MAVGNTGTTWYSLDLQVVSAWMANDMGTTDRNGVHQANGYWVVVGASGALYYGTQPNFASTSTINGGTQTNADATDGWGVVGFALIGTTAPAAFIEAPSLISLDAVRHASTW
jgi:hypothetical protein